MAIGICKVCGRVVKSQYSHGRSANRYPALCSRHRNVSVDASVQRKVVAKRRVTILFQKYVKAQGRRSPPTT